MPYATGSLDMPTIGMVRVACLSASTVRPENAKMRSVRREGAVSVTGLAVPVQFVQQFVNGRRDFLG